MIRKFSPVTMIALILLFCVLVFVFTSNISIENSSVIDIVSPDFPVGQLFKDTPEEILEKYEVADVYVEPAFHSYYVGESTIMPLLIFFRSYSGDITVIVNNIELNLDGESINMDPYWDKGEEYHLYLNSEVEYYSAILKSIPIKELEKLKVGSKMRVKIDLTVLKKDKREQGNFEGTFEVKLRIGKTITGVPW